MANLSLCEQMKVKVFGKPMWKYGFWDLMFRVARATRATSS